MAVQLTQAFNEFVNPWALDAIGWKYVSSNLHNLFNYKLIVRVSIFSTVAGYFWNYSLF
jgi:hypothetical protein